MSELFTERDFDVRVGLILKNGRLTWQAMLLAAIVPWLVILIARAL